ncbi:hypothetical protein EV401DRAFT_1987891 [Pisolithus croceorrhizus]|nr:hypothetical protein EV401DRAFT_1987891 [Pisolithus croceorrhizus]
MSMPSPLIISLLCSALKLCLNDFLTTSTTYHEYLLMYILSVSVFRTKAYPSGGSQRNLQAQCIFKGLLQKFP